MNARGKHINHGPVRRVGRGLARGLLVAALVGTTGTTALAAAPAELPKFIEAPQGISCDTTPFGQHAPMAQDIEAMSLLATTGLDAIDEYRPPVGAESPPFVRVYRGNLLQAGLTGAKFQRAVSIDFNGDGRDEVVAAYRMPGGDLKLGVYRRTTPAGAVLFDTWSMSQTFSQVELVAGDLDGSKDGHQELGVLLRMSSGGVRVFVLDGDGNGGIAEMDNSQAGLWQRPGPYNVVSLAVGDLLLSGHEQLVLVGDSGFGQSRVLNYELMEYLPSTDQLPIAAGDVAIGSVAFTSPMDTFSAGIGVDDVLRIDADAGDLVDGAAAELVLHVQFKQSNYDYIGQRLVHFTTTRNENNGITGIDLYRRSVTQDFDADRLVQNQNENGLADFEATIANVDARAPAEIVLARSVPGGQVKVSAYTVAVDRMAGFTYVVNTRTANFVNTSTGEPVGYSWDFGDGTGSIHATNPTHTYSGTETSYTVKLTATYADNSTLLYQQTLNLGTTSSNGGDESVWQYHFGGTAYEASYPISDVADVSFLNIATGDMNRDGTVDVLTAMRDTNGVVVRSRWWLQDLEDPASFIGAHQSESQSAFNSMTAMDLVASDFDGDSLHGTLGDECVQVTEPQVRQVVWLPPYFGVLQSAAERKSSWGQSTSGTSSSETRSGSYTSHDVSGYVGVEVGTPDNLPYTIEASVSFTAGRNWQTAHGQVHGEDSTLTVDQGSEQSQGEALLIYEENSFDCYSYDVFRAAGGLDPDSEMRMCAQIEGSRYLTAGDAVQWDTTIPAQTINDPAIGHKPAQWFPLQRDWSSLALFRSVSSNTAFVAGGAADRVTDGVFGTEARSGGASSQPYIQIDLGRVRDISNIRVFPAAGEAAYLTGFRLYASRTPMSGNGVPSGAGISVYVQETEDNASYDRWNIWTRSPVQPTDLLKARYIRLQHPGSATLRIAEVQVFGDLHLDPPAYPQAVCDQDADDDVFSALVWNPLSARFAAIDVRGNLLWSGAGTWPKPGGDDDYPDCTNNANVTEQAIWPTTVVGASATSTWNLSQSQGSLNGTTRSFDNATRVGAAFDFKAGFIAKVIAGAAYEFTKGITREVQNTSYWSEGLDIGGAVGGFDASYQGVVNTCRYNPRPYAYHQPDRSDTGYRHDVYTVDYVVREGPALWKRAAVPSICYGDRIFASGFED